MSDLTDINDRTIAAYLDSQDAAADWTPITADDPEPWRDQPLITYGEWLDERRARGIPGGLPETYHRECNHHGPIWTGETCPACGNTVWERRDGRIDCHVCEVWWTGRDELDAAAAGAIARRGCMRPYPLRPQSPRRLPKIGKNLSPYL